MLLLDAFRLATVLCHRRADRARRLNSLTWFLTSATLLYKPTLVDICNLMHKHAISTPDVTRVLEELFNARGELHMHMLMHEIATTLAFFSACVVPIDWARHRVQTPK